MNLGEPVRRATGLDGEDEPIMKIKATWPESLLASSVIATKLFSDSGSGRRATDSLNSR
jgi:hypothetical protein